MIKRACSKLFVLLAAVLLAAVLLPAAVLAAEPQSAPGIAGAGQVARMIGGLLVMVVVIVGLAALLKRFNGLQRGGPGAIRVVSTASIGARERLLLVEVGGQQLLVGAAPGRIQALMVLDEPVTVAPGAAHTAEGGFAARLRDAVRAVPREPRA